jgi:hypothetical protein
LIDKAQVFVDTSDHIRKVNYFIQKAAFELLQRGIVHDQSKLESPELEIFAEYTPKLKNSTYGSEEYKGFLKEMKVALDHHYAVSRHHPEHYTEGIRSMSLIDLLEMICDWKAATLRHNDGNIQRSITINKERFKYGDELEAILRNTAELL